MTSGSQILLLTPKFSFTGEKYPFVHRMSLVSKQKHQNIRDLIPEQILSELFGIQTGGLGIKAVQIPRLQEAML